MAKIGEAAREPLMSHLGETDACMVDGQNAAFGSDLSEPEKGLGSTPFGATPDEALVTFCGGAGTMDSPEVQALTENDASMEEQDFETQSPLDYVVQNLQCRTGNPRNRCFANAPFRLWAWAGSFQGGPRLWNKTTAAVVAALKDDGVVNITSLTL